MVGKQTIKKKKARRCLLYFASHRNSHNSKLFFFATNDEIKKEDTSDQETIMAAVQRLFVRVRTAKYVSRLKEYRYRGLYHLPVAHFVIVLLQLCQFKSQKKGTENIFCWRCYLPVNNDDLINKPRWQSIASKKLKQGFCFCLFPDSVRQSFLLRGPMRALWERWIARPRFLGNVISGRFKDSDYDWNK